MPRRHFLAASAAALVGGCAWAAAHPDAHTVLMAKETGLAANIWQETARRSLRPPVPITPDLIAAEQQTADRYVRAGLLPKRIDVAPGFDRSLHG